MPNYNLVVNSSFKPFTFSEYIAPYQLYEKEYKDIENSISDLSQKAGVFEMLKNNAQDAETYNLYKGYADDLKAEAEALASGSAPLGVRRNALMDMRRRYSEEIMPIEVAYKARDKEAEVQRQAQLSDPTFRANRYAANTSLSDYIANPQLNFQSYSGQKLTKFVSDAALNLARYYMENPGEFKKILEGTYYERMDLTGLTPQTVLQTLNSTDKGSKILRKILDDSVTNTGVRNWYPEGTPEYDDSVKEAYGFANMGAWSAIGQGKPEVLVNRGYDLSGNNGGSDKDENDDIESSTKEIVRAYMSDDARKANNDLQVINNALDDLTRGGADNLGDTNRRVLDYGYVEPLTMGGTSSTVRDILNTIGYTNEQIDDKYNKGELKELLNQASIYLSDKARGVEYMTYAPNITDTQDNNLLKKINNYGQGIDFVEYDENFKSKGSFDKSLLIDPKTQAFSITIDPMMPDNIRLTLTDSENNIHIVGVPYSIFGFTERDITLFKNYMWKINMGVINGADIMEVLTPKEYADFVTKKEEIGFKIRDLQEKRSDKAGTKITIN